MPIPALDSISKKSGVSVKDLERYWDQGKKSAKEAGLKPDTDNFYAYVMAIVKKRAGLKESLNFKDFYEASKSSLKNKLLSMAGQYLNVRGLRDKQKIYDKFKSFCDKNNIDFENAWTGALKQMKNKSIATQMMGYSD